MSRRQSVDPTDRASVYAALGEQDAAMKWLEAGYAEHAPNMTFVAALLFFDDLRSDPRFEDLMRRMGPPWSTMHVG
jgi:hypothetical protein